MAAGFASIALAGLAACSGGTDSAQPVEPTNTTTAPLQLRNAAFIADVNVKNGTIVISSPTATLSASEKQALGQKLGGPSLSLLSNDVIQLTATNYRASAPSGGKIRVQFDVAVTNKLGGISLVTPTFPTAPTGQNGLLLFPYSFNVTTTSGGTGTTGGNETVVELPSRGEVAASVDWNGNGAPDLTVFPAAPGAGGDPFNFFNDQSCPATTSADTPTDCFRYETYAPLAGGATSTARRIGFDVDASVGQFRVRILAAADLLTGSATGTGSVTGTISSPTRGPLAGVTVNLEASGNVTPASVVTNASGVYTFTGIQFGNRNVTIQTTSLPSGCTTISPLNGQNVTINSVTPAITQNYSVTCANVVGRINGTVTRTGAGIQNLDGITYTITPAAAGFAPVSGQVLGGSFSNANVSVGFGTGAGNGTVALSNLPAGCTAVAPASYTGLTAAAAQSVALTVDCTAAAAPSFLTVVSQFGAASAGSVDLTISVDPTGYSAASDAIAGYQGITTITGAAASRFVGRSAVPTLNFGSASLGGTLPATGVAAATATSGGFTTPQNVAVIRYTIGAGAAGVATTATTVTEISDQNGNPYSLILTGASQNTQITEATINLP